LEKRSQEVARIVAKRGPETAELGTHDLRALSLHVRGMLRDWVRLNTARIITAAENKKADLIVFESLRGFRAPGYDNLDEAKKRRLAFFSHGRIRHKVREKAVERGMRVITVPYLKSSQYCGYCGKEKLEKAALKKNKRKHSFQCEYCGYGCHSDVNAARVLGRVFWGEIVLPTHV
jgi:transposase